MKRMMPLACLTLMLTGAVASAGVVGGAFGQAGAVAGGKTPEQAASEPKPASQSGEKPAGEKPAGEKPARPDAQAIKALDTAIKTLAREYRDFEKNPTASVRTESNYFKDNAIDVPADTVWDRLGRRLDSDAAVDGYIKWQLLSLPSVASVEGKQVARAVRAYRSAPLPLPRPGMAGNNQLARALQGKKEAAITQINTELTSAVQANAARNAPILKYRDALYDRLPPGPETFELGLRDFMGRQQAGADAKDLATKIAAGIRAWAPTAKKPQLNAIGSALVRASHETGPEFYTAAEWRDAKRGGEWTRKRVGEEATSDLAALVTELQTSASAGAGAGAAAGKKGK